MGPKSWRLALSGILLLSFALRVVYVLQSRSSPAFESPSMDALYHIEWARAFAAGRDYQPGPFFRAPLYPWFLGVLLKITGGNLLAVRLVQSALGTASVALVALVARRAFDARTALLAALIAGTYWVTIYFEGDFLLPVLEIFLDLLAIELALRLDDAPSAGRAACAGAVFGLAAIVRPNILLFVPVVVVWIFLRGWRTSREGAARGSSLALPSACGLAFALAFLLPIAPITAYNRAVGKDWVLVSSQGGVNFWIGNHPGANGQTAIVPGTRPDWWGGYEDSIRLAELEEGRTLRPSEVSRHYARKAWSWIRTEPAAAARLALWKLRLFWTDWELGNNTSETFFAMRFGPVLRWLPIGFGALAPLGLLGFLLCAPAWRRLLPLWGFLPVYTASVVAFFVCSRFRVPVIPVLAIFAAHAVVRLAGMVRERRIPGLAASAFFLGAAIVFVEAVPKSIDRTESQGYWELGLFELQRGDPRAAVSRFEESIRRKPDVSVVHQDLGIALRHLAARETEASLREAQGREAEASLREALRLDPGNAVAAGNLVDLLIGTSRLAEAEPLARAAVARSPVYAPLRYDLGRLLYFQATGLRESGAGEAIVHPRLEAALAELTKGSELASDASTRFRCAYAAGRALTDLGRREEAVGAFERAVAALPDPPPREGSDGADEAWWWQCQGELISSLAATGRSAEARGRREDLLRRFPGDPRASRLPVPSGP